MKNSKAIGVVVVLVALATALVAVPPTYFTPTHYTQQTSVQLINSKIDNSPIGAAQPANGYFVTSRLASYQDLSQTAQGYYAQWNYELGIGEADNIDLRGSGGGGFNWYIGNNTNSLIKYMTLRPSFGNSGILQVTRLQGNADTATSLAAAPGQCASDGSQIMYGIQANGQPLCAAKPPVPLVESFRVTGCAPTTSTDAACNGSIALPTSMGNISYTIEMTTESLNGSFLYTFPTAHSATGINYTTTCTFNCGTITAPTIHVFVRHD